MKLKVNILNSEMRKHYWKTTKEVQKTLLEKFKEKEEMTKSLLSQTLQVIEDNSDNLHAGDKMKQDRKLNELKNLELQEQKLRPVHKVRVLTQPPSGSDGTEKTVADSTDAGFRESP